MKSNKRKFVLVVSSNRADYGLLEPLMKQLISEKEINFGLIVTGSHLLKKYGFTFNDINPKIQRKALAKIKVLESTSKTTMIKNTGYLIEKFSSIFKKLKPDLVIILGDRYEIFSAATSCHLLQIPLTHIHGGEVTSGALDDGFRHSITKFSDLHFTSSVAHRKRVIQLGEQPRKVFNVGPLVLDNFLDLKFLSKTVLRKKLKISRAKKDLLVRLFAPLATIIKQGLFFINCVFIASKPIAKAPDFFVIEILLIIFFLRTISIMDTRSGEKILDTPK